MFEKLYRDVYGEYGQFERQFELLQYFDNPAPFFHWMTLPKTGYLIASRYNVALVVLSEQMCCTYLPLRTSVIDPPICICIGFVNQNHFIQVFLREGHPIPPIIYMWYRWCYPCASGWATVYTEQLTMYNHIVGSNSRISGTEIIDSDE